MDTFSYEVCDGGTPSLCASAMVMIEVTPRSDTMHLTVEEDGLLSLCSDTVLNLSGGSSFQEVIWIDEGDGYYENTDPLCFEYEPTEDFNGLDTVWMVVCQADICDTMIYIIDVLPVNDAPIVMDDHG